MLSVGLDFHKYFSFVTVMDEGGKILKRAKLENHPDTLLCFFGQLKDRFTVAVEATWNWYWLQELFENHAIPMKLVHPQRAKAIASARIKTDKIDSEILAHLLRTDLLPEAHIPTRATRLLRERLRYRASLVRLLAQIRNKLHALVAKNGLRLPSQNILSKKSLSYLTEVSLADAFRQAIDGYLRVAELLREEIDRVSLTITAHAQQDHRAMRLTELYGIGYYLALLIVAEIDDISRFERAKSLCAYAGIVSSVHSSGQTHYTGSITKQGSKWLRWALVEAAQHIQRKPPFDQFYQRIKTRRGPKIARVAVARKLCKVIYYMLVEEQNAKTKSSKKRIQSGKPVGVMVS
jgi:transposase